MKKPGHPFDGVDIRADEVPRLQSQFDHVYEIMSDGKWRSLARLEELTGYPQASISAHLRSFRKVRFGGWNVERRLRPTRRAQRQYRIRGRREIE